MMYEKISDLLKVSKMFCDVNLDEYTVNDKPAIAAKVAMAKALGYNDGSHNTYGDVADALGYEFKEHCDMEVAKASIYVFEDGTALEETNGDPRIYWRKEEYAERNDGDIEDEESPYNDYSTKCLSLWP